MLRRPVSIERSVVSRMFSEICGQDFNDCLAVEPRIARKAFERVDGADPDFQHLTAKLIDRTCESFRNLPLPVHLYAAQRQDTAANDRKSRKSLNERSTDLVLEPNPVNGSRHVLPLSETRREKEDCER